MDTKSLIVLLAAGGAAYYFFVVKNKGNAPRITNASILRVPQPQRAAVAEAAAQKPEAPKKKKRKKKKSFFGKLKDAGKKVGGTAIKVGATAVGGPVGGQIADEFV